MNSVIITLLKRRNEMLKKIKALLPLIMIALGLLIALSGLLPALKANNGDAIMSGYRSVFGGTIPIVDNFVSIDVQFNFINFLAYLLPLLGSLAFYFVSKRSNDQVTNVVYAAALFLVFFTSIYIFDDLGSYTKGVLTGTTIEFTYSAAKLGVGGVIASILGMIGLVGSVLHGILQFRD